MGIKHTEDFKRWRNRWKDGIIYASGGKCQCCEYDRCSQALEFHHVDPSNKDFTIGSVKTSPTMNDKVEEELLKCVLVCSNCHKEIHAGLRYVPDKFVKFDRVVFVEYMKSRRLTKQKRLSDEKRNEILRLYSEGKSFRFITKSLKSDRITIKRVLGLVEYPSKKKYILDRPVV